MRYLTAWEIAKGRMRAQRLTIVRPTPVCASVLHRPAALILFTPRPVSILAPRAETEQDIKDFVRNEFAEAARKRSA